MIWVAVIAVALGVVFHPRVRQAIARHERPETIIAVVLAVVLTGALLIGYARADDKPPVPAALPEGTTLTVGAPKAPAAQPYYDPPPLTAAEKSERAERLKAFDACIEGYTTDKLNVRHAVYKKTPECAQW